MLKKALLLVLALGLLLPATLAQDDENPTVAILRFGPHYSYSVIERALIDALPVHGLIKADERAVLLEGKALNGEKLNVIWGDANFDFASANLVVEAAIDAGADVLVTLSTPLTLVATTLTADMDDPPAIIFSAVYQPYEAGIAQSSCIKPDNLTGFETSAPYEDIVPLLLLQNPDLQIIGTVYNSNEISGLVGARDIIAVAESLGIEVEEAAVTNVTELAVATEGLVSAGVEALLIPTDMTTVSGLPVIMQVAIENGIPVFHSVPVSFIDGATVGAGGFIEPTLNSALMAMVIAQYLDGSLDIARAGIILDTRMQVNVNLDMARAQGVEVNEELLAMADFVLRDGLAASSRAQMVLSRFGMSDEEIEIALRALANRLQGLGTDAELTPAVRKVFEAVAAAGAVDHAALLEANRCTPERIAEQQAALEG